MLNMRKQFVGTTNDAFSKNFTQIRTMFLFQYFFSLSIKKSLGLVPINIAFPQPAPEMNIILNKSSTNDD